MCTSIGMPHDIMDKMVSPLYQSNKCSQSILLLVQRAHSLPPTNLRFMSGATGRSSGPANLSSSGSGRGTSAAGGGGGSGSTSAMLGDGGSAEAEDLHYTPFQSAKLSTLLLLGCPTGLTAMVRTHALLSIFSSLSPPLAVTTLAST